MWSGTVILIGATTESVLRVNSALVSRSQVTLLRPLAEKTW